MKRRCFNTLLAFISYLAKQHTHSLGLALVEHALLNETQSAFSYFKILFCEAIGDVKELLVAFAREGMTEAQRGDKRKQRVAGPLPTLGWPRHHSLQGLLSEKAHHFTTGGRDHLS